MFISQSAHTSFRPMRTSSIRQSLRQHFRQKSLGQIVPQGTWRVVVKVLLPLCPLVLLVNFWLSSTADRLAAEMLVVEEGRYLLQDEHIRLRAERARLYSPGYLNEVAANQLALYVPGKKQVTRF